MPETPARTSGIERLAFTRKAVDAWSDADPRRTDWPVVYVLDDERNRRRRTKVYVGESLNAAARMRQHLKAPSKQGLRHVRVLFDTTFNKSACLDLESYLIGLLAGDARYEVLNLNGGIRNADYFDRDQYRDRFDELFDAMRTDGLLTRPVEEIKNTDLFKLSPFKALDYGQAVAVEDIVEGLLADLAAGRPNTVVVQGDPGTGKTVVAIYLIKLLRDIQLTDENDLVDPDWMFAEFFTPENRRLLQDFRIGFVVPQQSLRASIRKVFTKTPGLDRSMILSPFDVGLAEDGFDLLLVDETHRLNQRSSQSSGRRNADFRTVTERLFGTDDRSKTQLDWVVARSRQQVLLVDPEQTVRPSDLPRPVLDALVTDADAIDRLYRLTTQMRVRAGSDYVGYVRAALRADRLSPHDPAPTGFGEYELRFFDDLGAMVDHVREREARHGLSRLVAGYAWPWRSRSDPDAYDIEIDGLGLRWNSTDQDWISRPTSVDEVGSIHTVQGYDLNYAGVIIGPELGYDPEARRLVFRREQYHDAKGKQNNGILGLTYSDDDLLEYVLNVYGVLLTRGIRGTALYVCDPGLREHMRPYFAS